MQKNFLTLERSQAKFRFSFVAIFVVYLGWASHFDKTFVSPLGCLALALYLVCALGMLAVSHRAVAISALRLNACIIIDQACMALLYLAFGKITTPVLLCPALASIGYGVRYGPGYAYKSALAGFVCLVPAMAWSAYWRSVPLTAAGLIVSNCCLPVYAAAISQQIRKDNWRIRRRASDLLVAKEAADNQLRRDSLTGLLNRFGLDEVIDSTLREPGALVAVAAMDLDGFKQLNDLCGHQTGDALLVTVAGLIRRHISGAAARYGGDEFVFSLCGPCTRHDVIGAFERLRADIAALEFASGARVSASIGICLIDGSSDVQRAGVLDCADKLMYLAKRSGRNRIQTNRAAIVEAA